MAKQISIMVGGTQYHIKRTPAEPSKALLASRQAYNVCLAAQNAWRGGRIAPAVYPAKCIKRRGEFVEVIGVPYVSDSQEYPEPEICFVLYKPNTNTVAGYANLSSDNNSIPYKYAFLTNDGAHYHSEIPTGRLGGHFHEKKVQITPIGTSAEKLRRTRGIIVSRGAIIRTVAIS